MLNSVANDREAIAFATLGRYLFNFSSAYFRYYAGPPRIPLGARHVSFVFKRRDQSALYVGLTLIEPGFYVCAIGQNGAELATV